MFTIFSVMSIVLLSLFTVSAITSNFENNSLKLAVLAFTGSFIHLFNYISTESSYNNFTLFFSIVLFFVAGGVTIISIAEYLFRKTA